MASGRSDSDRDTGGPAATARVADPHRRQIGDRGR